MSNEVPRSPLFLASVAPTLRETPPSPPSTLTRLEKRAKKAGRKIGRSESESTGEVEGQLESKVAGPINMTEPWVEGPKSAKVSDPRLSFLFFLTSLV